MSQTILNLKGWKILLKSKGNNHPLGTAQPEYPCSGELELVSWWELSLIVLPFGCLCFGIHVTYLQAHSSAPLGSCPCIPQMNNSKAETGVSLWLSSSVFCKADLCQCSRVQFRPVHYFCADHYSGMGVTWCFWHLDHDWEETMYVTKAVVL